eukprot:7768680-Heterocapsa_arctica.AAC.1
MLPHAIVHAAISSTIVNVGIPPTPRDFTAVEAAQVGMVWRIARRLAFVAAGNTWATFLDVDPCE